MNFLGWFSARFLYSIAEEFHESQLLHPYLFDSRWPSHLRTLGEWLLDCCNTPLYPEILPSSAAMTNILNKRSEKIVKRDGDIGSPCLSLRPALKKPWEVPLRSIENFTNDIHAIPKSIKLVAKSIFLSMISKIHYSTMSYALTKSILTSIYPFFHLFLLKKIWFHGWW